MPQRRHAVRTGAPARLLPRAAQAAMAAAHLGAGLLLVAVVAGRVFLHLGLAPVLSGSMRPTFAPGDAVLTRLVDVRSSRPGAIAVFVPPGEPAPFAHRVVSVTGDASAPVITTKGDANPAPDSWHARLPGPRVPIVVARLPKAGYLLVAVRDRRWRAVLLGLIGLSLTFYATRRALVPARLQQDPSPPVHA